MTETETALVDFPLRQPGQPFPPESYAGYRQQDRLVRSKLLNGAIVWLVSRHEDVRAVLSDSRISSNPTHPGFPNAQRTGGVPSTDEVPGWFVALDPPDHDRFRKALIPEFTVRRVREMTSAVQGIVDDRIDAMLAAGDTADLVSDLALPVPSLVISSLLGVPRVDRDFFEAKTRILVTMSSTDAQRETATADLLRYLTRLIAIKRRRPGDDLLSRMLANGDMTPEEMSGVGMLLLIAGHETTANNISLGVMTLLQNARWIGDPRVVEEMLRFCSVADLVALRVAIKDVEIGGQLIKAGEGIVPLVASANHDAGVFAHPESFDPSRPPHGHVAFGYGVHQCLGQNLVRLEMDVLCRTLFTRIPTLELAAPVDELPYKHDGVLYGLHALPVRWKPDPA
jgi:cytochrome P450 monooxygenase